MTCTIRAATPSDTPAIERLLPRLASFEVPIARKPSELWSGDLETLKRWQRGDRPDCLVHVAADNGQVVGATLVTLRDELLSQEPSAHLEVLVLSDLAEGRGIGRALLANAETVARDHGAKSMSLHVFANNTRARKLYERAGFDSELLRCYKSL